MTIHVELATKRKHRFRNKDS